MLVTLFSIYIKVFTFHSGIKSNLRPTVYPMCSFCIGHQRIDKFIIRKHAFIA